MTKNRSEHVLESPPWRGRGWVGGILGLGAFLLANTAPAAAPADINPLLEKIRAEYKLPALAAAVVRGTNIVSLGAVGVRKLGRPERVTVDDKFHIGSCTKSMTATLAAMMVEDGTIQWTNTLGDILTDLVPAMNPQYRDDPLDLLLANRGGVPGDLNGDGLWSRLWERAAETPLAQRNHLAEELTKTEPAAKPGTKFIYANAGFALGGHMLEVRAGKPWEELIRDRLFKPLGMKTAGFGAPASVGKIDQPWGHRPAKFFGDDSPVEPGLKADNPAAIGPAGTVHCSIGDLARYAAFHLQGARGHGWLISQESFRKLHTALAGQDYAMGWSVTERSWGGGKVLTHTGSNTMFYTVIWIAPEKDFAVVVSANLGGFRAEKGTDAAAWALIQAHLLQPAP